MNLCIIGTGYVGLPTGVGMAELGNNVICVDVDKNKIDRLNNGHITLFEDGLEELFVKNLKNKRLKFTTSMKDGVKDADVIVIAVGTPPNPLTNEADMKYINAAVLEMSKYLDKYTVVATKSTVPVGTGDEIENIIKNENPNANFDVVSLPEFLREGFAVYDFFNPDRIVIGSNSKKASDVLEKIYEPFLKKTNMLFVSRRSAETIKYASNAFLAIKIHYINEMANFCEKSGADIYEVAKGMGLDSRIGNKFLNPGPGYGGSCFPKDTNAMACMGDKYGVDLSLVKNAINGNEKRKTDMAKTILNHMQNIKNPKVAVLGLAFKDGTDDCRDSPAIDIIQSLFSSRDDLNIFVYDPEALENAKVILKDKVSYGNDMYDILEDADLLVILTEWKTFSKIDLTRTKSLMRGSLIIDLRNILNIEDVKNHGFSYVGVGR